MDVQKDSLSAYAEDHGLWPWMNAKRITFRSLVRRRVCFGGFRRRTRRYHGLCPWGSIQELFDSLSLPFPLWLAPLDWPEAMRLSLIKLLNSATSKT